MPWCDDVDKCFCKCNFFCKRNFFSQSSRLRPITSGTNVPPPLLVFAERLFSPILHGKRRIDDDVHGEQFVCGVKGLARTGACSCKNYLI
jgi:hypothetical protein